MNEAACKISVRPDYVAGRIDARNLLTRAGKRDIYGRKRLGLECDAARIAAMIHSDIVFEVMTRISFLLRRFVFNSQSSGLPPFH